MQDETEGKAQDTSARDSSGAGGSTSPETFTKAQLDEATRKAASDALAKAGRDAKSLIEKEKAIQEREARIAEAEARAQEAENEKYRDKPDELAKLQEKRRQKQERDEFARQKAELEKEKAEHAEELTKAQELKLELSVYKIAGQKNVDAGDLKDLCDALKPKDEAGILLIAEKMAKSGKGDSLRVDSNRGSGGDGASNLTPRELIAKGLKKQKK
jgi:hypothetical protein